MRLKVIFSLNKVKKLLPAAWVTFFCDAHDRKQTIFLRLTQQISKESEKCIKLHFFYLYFLILWKLLIFDEMLMSAEIKGCIMCFIHFWILLKWGITVTHFMIVGYVLQISNIQYVCVGTFWVQKVRQEKLTKFTKVFELYQVFHV